MSPREKYWNFYGSVRNYFFFSHCHAIKRERLDKTLRRNIPYGPSGCCDYSLLYTLMVLAQNTDTYMYGNEQEREKLLKQICLSFTPPFWSQNLEKTAQLIYKQIASPLPASSLLTEQADSRDTISPETQLMVRSYFTSMLLPWDSCVQTAEENTSLAHQKHL